MIIVKSGNVYSTYSMSEFLGAYCSEETSAEVLKIGLEKFSRFYEEYLETEDYPINWEAQWHVQSITEQLVAYKRNVLYIA